MARIPSVVPMLAYEDGPSAMDWLVRAFGFLELTRIVDKRGVLQHGELETGGGGRVMLATPSPDYESPRRHRERCEPARKWSSVPYVVDGVLVLVDNVDAHFARAQAAGATIMSPLEDGAPGRRYRCEDVEGHRWMFVQRPPAT